MERIGLAYCGTIRQRLERLERLEGGGTFSVRAAVIGMTYDLATLLWTPSSLGGLPVFEVPAIALPPAHKAGFLWAVILALTPDCLEDERYDPECVPEYVP